MDWAETLRRRTMAFAIAVIRFCARLPRSIENDVIRRQLAKAGSSVGANYRSSCRGRSGNEWSAKLGIAIEEADESNYWLTILQTLEPGPSAERDRLLRESDELTRLLAASVRTFRSRRGSDTRERRCNRRQSHPAEK
jgi:four helix bundle protein